MESIIHAFINDSISGAGNAGNVLNHLIENKVDIKDFCNTAAIITAQRFLNNELSYEHADAVINDIYSLYIGEEIELPEPADSIYLAFDRGEYALGDEDPVADHTRPMLKNILANHIDSDN